jgi:hypothetical protein
MKKRPVIVKITRSKKVRVLNLPELSDKIKDLSDTVKKRGVVAGGTLLSSGSREATVTFTPPVTPPAETKH